MALMNDLTKYSEEYKKQLQKLDNEPLKSIVENREKALEAAKKGIEQIEPEKLTQDHIEAMANEIQVAAKMIWEERTK